MDMIQILLDEGVSIIDPIAVTDFFKSCFGIQLDGYLTWSDFIFLYYDRMSFIIQNGKTIRKMEHLQKNPFLVQINHDDDSWELFFVYY